MNGGIGVTDVLGILTFFTGGRSVMDLILWFRESRPANKRKEIALWIESGKEQQDRKVLDRLFPLLFKVLKQLDRIDKLQSERCVSAAHLRSCNSAVQQYIEDLPMTIQALHSLAGSLTSRKFRRYGSELGSIRPAAFYNAYRGDQRASLLYTLNGILNGLKLTLSLEGLQDKKATNLLAHRARRSGHPLEKPRTKPLSSNPFH